MFRYFLVFAIGFLSGGFVWHSGYESGKEENSAHKSKNDKPPSDIPKDEMVGGACNYYKI